MSLEIDVRKLDLFNQMSREGAVNVAEYLTQMTGIETGIEVSKINFLDIEDVKTHMGEGEAIGIFVELTDPPYGYVLFMLDPADSKRLAVSMVGEGDPDLSAGFSEMEKSAIQEVGNIMTSGFIDGWANVLETTIGMSTPTFAFCECSEVIDRMGGWPDEEIAFVLDSHITASDTDLDLTVYTFPHLRALVELIQDIDLDTDVAADTTAAMEFPD